MDASAQSYRGGKWRGRAQPVLPQPLNADRTVIDDIKARRLFGLKST